MKEPLQSFRPSILAALIICLSVSSAAALEYETFDPIWGRSILAVPDSTEQGVWTGTWLYKCLDYRMAIWLREGEQGPELKLRFSRYGLPEEFTTDWKGHATYTSQNAPGQFSLLITEGDANTILATWNWDLQFADSGKTENGRVIITRAGDGRALVLTFEDLTKTIRRGQQSQTRAVAQALTFLKASKRLVRWEELP